MNHRETPHLPRSRRLALLCLALALPAVTPPGVHAQSPTLTLRVVVSRNAEPTPYLLAVGAPALRFQEPAPALEPIPPAVSPVPTSVVNETPAPVANASSPPSSVASHSADPASDTNKSSPADSTPPPAKAPTPILPDDTRPAVRPEDFLPYFQIPGSARHPEDVTLLVPAPKSAPSPAPLPPSSATYTQTPK
jgi:hypothetical protein